MPTPLHARLRRLAVAALFGLMFGLGVVGASALVAALTAAPAGAAPERYRVEAGDTIWDVAQRHDVRVDALIAANDLDDPDVLVSGTVLVIPSAAASSSTGGSTPSTSTTGSGSYTVTAGDTWWGIARRSGTTPEALAAANGTTAAAVLRPGDVLGVPTSGPTSASSSGSAAPAVAPASSSTSSTSSTSSSSSGATYTVRAGDTLTRIAARSGTTAAVLAERNGMAVDDLLLIGTELTIPAAASSPAPAPTVAEVPARLPSRIRSEPERLALLPVFEDAADEFGVPSDLLMSVGYMESGWQPDVVSYKGAMGVGQLMPQTAEMLADWMGEASLDPWEPTDNIRMSARYLRSLIDLNGGDSSAALADYYQGHASVQRRGRDQDTQRYVSVIESNRPMFS